ncbi:MAG: permease prefix domain 1-containing protein [Vicinamibacterales bacterium]|nr:permease prefix domain 1-containing protein [Vicinamibacterales bacterium]
MNIELARRAFRAGMTRLLDVFRSKRQERELAAELQAHLELHIDENLRAGMHPAEARRVAHARLGGVEQVKERCRETNPLRRLGGFWLDV